MGAPVPVTLTNDFSAGYSTHLFLAIPPVPPPTINSAIEIPIPHGWPPGDSAGKVQKTTTVFAKGKPILLDQHDCGPVIPQITIPPANSLFPVQLFKSKRAITVTCFSVRMNGKTTACTGLWPPIPLLTCGDPMSLPLTFTFTNVGTNVHVGVSVADVVGGLILTAASMAIDYLFFRLPDVKLTPLEEFAKALLGAAASLVASLVQHAIDPRYPIRVDFKMKAPGGVEIKVNFSAGSTDTANNPSKVAISVEKKWESKDKSRSATVGASGEYTWNAGGDKAKEGFKGQVGAGASGPGVSGKASAGGEYHPDAPEQQRSKLTGKVEGNSPVASGSGQVDYNPNAPAGQGVTTKTESVDKGLSGDKRTTTTHNPDGSTTTTTVENKGGKVTTTTVKTPAPGKAPKSSGAPAPGGATNTAQSGIWGTPL